MNIPEIIVPPAGDYNYWHRPVYNLGDVPPAGPHPVLLEPPRLFVQLPVNKRCPFPTAD